MSTPQAVQTSSFTPKPKNKPVGSVNIVVAPDFEGDSFWMAEEETLDNNLTCIVSAEPDLLLGTSDNADSTWHSEEEGDLDLEPETLIEVGAIITPANKGKDAHIHTELYNSGMTWHISPYKHDFITYLPLTPLIFLNAANQQKFPAIGHGTLVVQVPLGDDESRFTLHSALHMPAVSYTLVSIGALDMEGYHAHIGGSSLKLTSPQGECTGCIPCTQGCLYKIVHALDSANAAEPVLVMELHCCLGHIAVSSVCKLVESGAVVKVKLDPGSQEGDCNACVYAHTTCLPVPKVRISPPAQNFRNKVHTNVWGPTSVTTCQGHWYFITFTNNAMHYTVTCLLQTKDEALEAYKSYEAWATMQQHCKAVKVLCSDRGGEYLSTTFD